MSICRRLQIDPYLSPCTKLKSKWFKNLNRKRDTLNLIEERLENTLEHISTGDNFLNRTPKSQAIRSIIIKLDLLKLNSYVWSSTPPMRKKVAYKIGEKIINPVSNSGLIFKIYNELKN